MKVTSLMVREGREGKTVDIKLISVDCGNSKLRGVFMFCILESLHLCQFLFVTCIVHDEVFLNT